MSDFTWTSTEGVEVTLPAMDSLPAGVFRRHRNEDPVSFVFSVLEEMAAPGELEKLDSVPMKQVNDLFTAWQAHAEAEVPQS